MAFELSDDPQQPTLSDRLQRAAVERARVRRDVVDDVVLDEDGVIDLSRPASPVPGAGATHLPAAVASTGGSIDTEVDGLYAPAEESSSWWRRGRGRPDLRPGNTDAVPSSPSLSSVPLTTEVGAEPEAPSDTEAPDTGLAVVDDDGETVIVAPIEDDPVVIDLTDTDTHDRPTGRCPKCGGAGQRDLFDRFSQIDYYSCDDCSAMWQAPHT